MTDYKADEKKLVVKDTKDSKDVKDKVADVPHKRTMRDVLLEERAAHPVVAVEAHLPTNVDDPLPEPPVLTPLTPDEQAKKDAKDALVKKVGEILAKYDNRESSIPANSEYWSLIAELRSLS